MLRKVLKRTGHENLRKDFTQARINLKSIFTKCEIIVHLQLMPSGSSRVQGSKSYSGLFRDKSHCQTSHKATSPEKSPQFSFSIPRLLCFC